MRRFSLLTIALIFPACSKDSDPNETGVIDTAADTDTDTDTDCWVSPTAAEEDPNATIEAKVCDPNKVLIEDGDATGLGRGSADGAYTVAGRSESACVQADMGENRLVSTVRIVARAVASTCGAACDDNCGTGQFFELFGSTNGVDYDYHGQINITGEFASYKVEVDDALRYALVCRYASGWDRDQLEIDYIEVCAE